MKQPCAQDCPDRSADCAATCEKWAAYVKERNAKYAERKMQSEFEECKHVVIERAKHKNFMKRRK